MASTLGPVVAACRGHCPEHPDCTGEIRQRHLVDWRRGVDPGPKPDRECDVCEAWYDSELHYLKHKPKP